MMWNEQKAQASIELVLVAGIVILLATTAALIAKEVLNQLSPQVGSTTNDIVSNIS
ncbi:MAG: hypothetical protein Q8P05_05890 [Candidatus Diapherotrites archaeon]|nr:hypothetical protein [Candidatus Diapherotrites archaeon]MDZ4256587.1 hypothetical protein [archaeon]